MSKYDFQIDLDENTTTGKLLGYVSPNSTVLEFGSANGRMTRYMKQELNCDVYIVEIDSDAYADAIRFAKDGICGDISDYIWCEKYNGIKFDCIMFADVLEHLYNPEQVLERTQEFLKEEGFVIFSVPNIAHNDILMNLYNNTFQYTSVGLLDDSHIRFFAYNTLESFCRKAGYEIVEEDATIAEPLSTEQNFLITKEMRTLLTGFISNRELYNIYQFVCKLQKKTYVTNENIIKTSKILHKVSGVRSNLFFDRGEGFNEDDKSVIFPDKLSNHCFLYYIEIESAIKSVRFDPVEGKGCIVQNLDVLSNDGPLTPINLNGIKVNNFDVFVNTDPQLVIDFDGKPISWLKIKANIIPFEDMAWFTLLSKFKDLQNKEIEMAAALKVKGNITANYKEINETLQSEIEEYKTHYLTAIHQREDLKRQLSEVSLAYQVIRDSNCWRMTKPLRVILNFVKKTLRSNRLTCTFFKGIKCLKENGLKDTLVKTKIKLSAKVEMKKYNKKNILSKEEREDQVKTIFEEDIKFSILVPIYNTPEKYLREMIDSVIEQTYEDWELCLADSSDGNYSYIQKICENYCNEDRRIIYQKLVRNLGISENTNKCIEMATGDYVALLDHDDVLKPNALFENALAIQETNADVLYSDEDHVNGKGDRFNPFFKPDWSPDLLYCQMYICHLLVIKKTLIDRIGGFNSEFDGSQDYDLMLRLSEATNAIVHIAKVLYSWRESENSTSINPDSKPYAHLAGLNALDQHLKRKYGKTEHAESSNLTFVYEARFGSMMENRPKISIIIPMIDKPNLTDNCIKSIRNKSNYQNYEIIVLNNRSVDTMTYEWFKNIQKTDSRIRVMNADFEFNWSKLNNFGIQHATGEVYIFLNNDTVIITEDWIERLCENALRQDIGVVGPLLLYEDDTIQHAGVVVGMGGWADHIFKGMEQIHHGCPYVSPMVNRNVLAVTGACMVISRETIDKIGNFNEEFIICGSDVEICIRAYDAGLNNLYLSSVKLYHLESRSRDSYIPENDFQMSYKCYTPFRENGDPYFNVNLDINSTIPKEREDKMDVTSFKNYLKRNPKINPMYQKMKKLIQGQTAIINIPEVQEIIPRKLYKLGEKMRLNLLIPSINEKHYFGGIATAIKFFDALAHEFNVDVRIIITDSMIDTKNSIPLEGYVVVPWSEDSMASKQIVCFPDRHNKSISIAKRDIFIATGWWTAYTIIPVIKWQAASYEIEPNKLLYFIQDYEPGFYPWSSRYLMADSTYKADIPVIAIFNSKYLNDYFNTMGYKFEAEFYFEPVLNDELRKYLLEKTTDTNRKKQILVYGRPSTQRNAFELVIAALKTWCLKQEDIEEWSILSVGEAHPDINLGRKVKLKSLGKLGLKEYAKILLESSIGISLMVSPHPSYPPLEMSTFGIKTITNQYGDKDLSPFNENIISLSNCSQDSIAEELLRLCIEYNPQGKICTNKAYIEGKDVFDKLTKNIRDILLEGKS